MSRTKMSGGRMWVDGVWRRVWIRRMGIRVGERLIIFIDRKKVPDLVWTLRRRLEIPIIYGYFIPNPEKYYSVKGDGACIMLHYKLFTLKHSGCNVWRGLAFVCTF